jgi:molecular chaperone DnaK
VARQFHATPRREIFPVVAGLAVLMIGRYSWKALNRMDQEWEDYLWELQRYERQRLKYANAAEMPLTIGVDIGTLYLKLSRMNGNQPELIETAQGDRYRFNGIILQEGGDVVTGKTALDKFYYPLPVPSSSEENGNARRSSVVLPYVELQQNTHSDAAVLVQNVFLPAIAEAMERVSSDTASSSGNGKETKRSLRTVLTLPPVFYNTYGESFFRNYHDDSHHTITVPEPVAALWGAQELGVLPIPQSKEENTSSTLVVDVGGLASTISLVRDDRLIYYTTLYKVGGESFVQQLVDRVLAEIGDETMTIDPMSLSLIQSNARGSVLELVNKTQSNVHIPYLFMGRKPNDPHLDMSVSRIVLEQAVQDYWNKEVVPELWDNGVLSASLPPPTGANALFTSALTKVLEESNELPTSIGRILLVGGGSRHKLFEEAVKESIFALMGPTANAEKLVMPEASLRSELTALGAASLLPNFDYDYDKGLETI